MTLTIRTPTTGTITALDPSDPGVDAGIYRLIDAVLELDGWTLSLGSRPDAFEVALVHRDEPGYVIPHFACGQTPGAAALAAVRRFHSIPDIERWAMDWPLAG
jgi:hypothetical protein